MVFRLTGTTASGLCLTLASAAFLSTLGILTQLAFAHGATMGMLLPGRFVAAAGLLWSIVWLRNAKRPSPRQVRAGLLLGAGFSAHAWLFSASLARLDAALVDLLLFTYPAFVTLGAVWMRRDRWTPRRALALISVAAGSVLVLAGGLNAIDPLGALLALGASLAYAAYILCSAGEVDRTEPLMLAALVSAGAAGTLTAVGVSQGDLSYGLSVPAFVLIAAVGLVAAAGMITFIAGVHQLGPARASIVSAVQPALTPFLGLAVFGDRLGPAQIAGGAVVLTGIVALEAGAISRRTTPAFGWLPRDERRALRRLARLESVPTGTHVFHQGTRADSLYLIMDGDAAVMLDDRHVAKLGPGEFFGEIALLTGGRRTASVVSACDLTVRVIPQTAFTTAMLKLPHLDRRVRRVGLDRLNRDSRPAQAA